MNLNKLIRKNIKLWLYGSCPGFSGAFPYFKTKVYFPKNYRLFERVCQEGIYEIENTKLLWHLVQPNSVYFDVGANIGLMSIPVLYKNDSCKVVSFEPSPSTIEFLNCTVENSQFGNRWRVIGKAVGSKTGSQDFYVTSSPRWSALEGFQDTKRAGNTRKITVPVTTLDTEWEAMGKPTVSVIKIDVEGAEIQVLQGSINCIKHEKPYILLEWNNLNLRVFGCEPASLLSFARSIKYEIVSLPKFVPVLNANHLIISMMQTENFLLIPG